MQESFSWPWTTGLSGVLAHHHQQAAANGLAFFPQPPPFGTPQLQWFPQVQENFNPWWQAGVQNVGPPPSFAVSLWSTMIPPSFQELPPPETPTMLPRNEGALVDQAGRAWLALNSLPRDTSSGEVSGEEAADVIFLNSNAESIPFEVFRMLCPRDSIAGGRSRLEATGSASKRLSTNLADSSARGILIPFFCVNAPGSGEFTKWLRNFLSCGPIKSNTHAQVHTAAQQYCTIMYYDHDPKSDFRLRVYYWPSDEAKSSTPVSLPRGVLLHLRGRIPPQKKHKERKFGNVLHESRPSQYKEIIRGVARLHSFSQGQPVLNAFGVPVIGASEYETHRKRWPQELRQERPTPSWIREDSNAVHPLRADYRLPSSFKELPWGAFVAQQLGRPYRDPKGLLWTLSSSQPVKISPPVVEDPLYTSLFGALQSDFNGDIFLKVSGESGGRDYHILCSKPFLNLFENVTRIVEGTPLLQVIQAMAIVDTLFNVGDRYLTILSSYVPFIRNAHGHAPTFAVCYIFHPKVDGFSYEGIGLELQHIFKFLPKSAKKERRIFCADGDLTLREGVQEPFESWLVKDCCVHLKRAGQKNWSKRHYSHVFDDSKGLLRSASREEFEEKVKTLRREDAEFGRKLDNRGLEDRLWEISDSQLLLHGFPRHKNSERPIQPSTNSGEGHGKHVKAVSGAYITAGSPSSASKLDLPGLMRRLAEDMSLQEQRFRRAFERKDRDLTLLPWVETLPLKLEELLRGPIENFPQIARSSFDLFYRGIPTPEAVTLEGEEESVVEPPIVAEVVDKEAERLKFADAETQLSALLNEFGFATAARMATRAYSLVETNPPVRQEETSYLVYSESKNAFYPCRCEKGRWICKVEGCLELKSELCHHILGVLIKEGFDMSNFRSYLLRFRPSLSAVAFTALKSSVKGVSHGKKKSSRSALKRKRSVKVIIDTVEVPAKRQRTSESTAPSHISLKEKDDEKSKSDLEMQYPATAVIDADPPTIERAKNSAASGPRTNRRTLREGNYGYSSRLSNRATSTKKIRLTFYERNHNGKWRNSRAADPNNGEIFVETPPVGKPERYLCSSKSCDDGDIVLESSLKEVRVAFFFVMLKDGQYERRFFCSLECLQEEEPGRKPKILIPTYYLTDGSPHALAAREHLKGLSQKYSIPVDY